MLQIRRDLRLLLELTDDLQVIGAAANGAAAVAQAAQLHPDVIVMDLEMPVMDGIAAAREIKTRGMAYLWILVFLGLASKSLNFSTPCLQHANEAVLPFHILHQPVLLSVGYFVVPWAIPDPVKYVIIAANSFAISILLYEFLVRRYNLLRFLFGMKPLPKPSAEPTAQPVLVTHKPSRTRTKSASNASSSAWSTKRGSARDSPLQPSENLRKSAREYGKELVKPQRPGSLDAKGKSPLQRAQEASYSQSQTVVELLGAGYQTPAQFMNALLANMTQPP